MPGPKKIGIEKMKERNGLIVDLVGCGGIGTWLLSATIQALHSSPLPKRIGGVVFVLHDSDVVEERNLHHQAFSPSDVGSLKVRAIRRRLSPFLGPDLGILAHPADVRGPEDLSSDGDVVVVAVDSPVARRAVHRSGRVFLDLRVSGDSAVLLDSSTDPEQVRLMTPDHPPASCQAEGAIESGNIQFGHLLAASMGAQWLIQLIRIALEEDASLPEPRIDALTGGTVLKLPLRESPGPNPPITPTQHDELALRPHIMLAASAGDGPVAECIREAIAHHASLGDWKSVWTISNSMGREISVIVDAESEIFVDVGNAHRVALSLPEGATAPMQWTHTHIEPLDSYWSTTDRDSLSVGHVILSEALVLSKTGIKRSVVLEEGDCSPRLAEEGPLSVWSDEPVFAYQEGG